MSRELEEAIETALEDHIPFELGSALERASVQKLMPQVAARLHYDYDYPRNFKHGARACYLDPEKGLRWGYIRNEKKVGWYEARESTPLTERSLVIKDSDRVYALKKDRL